MSPLENIAAKANTRRVFVSTEDQGVIDSLKDYPEFEFFFTTGHNRSNEAIWLLMETKRTTALKEALIAFRNLFIASMGTSFVGTFSSNWSRLVYELMLASHGGDESLLNAYSLDRGYFT